MRKVLENIGALAGAAVIMASALGTAAAKETAEINLRVQIAAATLEDAVVVDCQLPGRLQQLGGMRTYLTPGVLTRLSAIECRTRGGEYTVGDLAGGTLSLNRWLPLAEKDNVEAQYYVARIYANGMDGIPVDYAKAAQWYQRAAAKKFAPAMQELGYLYEQGLGVPKDALAGLNLQRQASGLGDELDYSSKITANKEEFDRQIATLTDQLASANSGVQDLRSQLDQANDQLQQSDTRLNQDRIRLRDMRAQLEQARRDDSGQSAARIKQLQEQLAASEAELGKRQETIGTLSADLNVQQTQLSAELSKAQAANSQLNELVASGRSENASLRARLAQSEERLVQSQQELSSVRAGYLHETQQLAARSAELQQIRAHGSDGVAAVIEDKQHEIDRQLAQIKSLEGQLADYRAHAAGGAQSAREQQDALTSLRAQYAQQQQELQAQRAAYARLQSQSKEEQAAQLASMTAQLSAKAAELEDRQRRIASLQTEANQLRETYNQDREASARAASSAGAELQQGRDALHAAQDTIAKQRDALDQLQMQSAAVQLQLVQARAASSQQAAGADRAALQKIAALEGDLKDKDKQIGDLRTQIASAEQDRSGKTSTLTASNVSYRMAESKAPGGADPAALLQLVRGLGPANYHALIIANSNYRHMDKLRTPLNDAHDIDSLLTRRYGFEVKVLIDATRDQIMAALNGYARTLSDADRLLIFFAGHGSTRDLPPERAFWAAVDTEPNVISSWLSAQTISDAIWQIHARHVLLVADSCFSSVITHSTSTIVARSNDEHSVRIQWSRGARMVLTSGLDQPVVDSSSVDAVHSLFADSFITVLRQNDILLSGEMLAHEISARMTTLAARLGIKQTPTYANLQDPQHMFGDFFFEPVAGAMQVASVN